MQITAELTFEEWSDLATTIGDAARSIGFIIGDWLVYGQRTCSAPTDFPTRRWTPPPTARLAATGLDRSTLQNYAYVSRSVPYSLRSERLSWEHHRLLAKLPEDKQRDWIDACDRRGGRRPPDVHPPAAQVAQRSAASPPPRISNPSRPTRASRTTSRS
jgi:hypothetical protein